MDTDGRGLSVGELAPVISTTDINGEKIDSEEILQNYDGLLIDFFRGAW
jgi:hypothetical protein